ncbi:MAG: hypothetical protein LBT89_04185 [Planctomycetaceae bacterium]|jgi:hypothetical protein|nr:hypothetical protein [Planctomycetaceae bacterium]
MFRFAVILCLSLCFAGCQSAAPKQAPAKSAVSQRFSATVKQCFANAAAVIKPDTDNSSGNKPTSKLSVFAAAAQNQPYQITPAAQRSNSLYQPGAISPPPQLLNTETLTVRHSPEAQDKRKTAEAKPEIVDTDTDNEPEEAVAVKRPKKKPRQIEFEPEYETDTETLAVRHSAAEKTPRENAAPTPAVRTEPAAPQYPNLAQLPNSPQIVQAGYTPQVAANHFIANNPANVPQGFGAGDWQTSLKASAEQLRYAVEHTPHGRTEQNEMRLRLMETLLGNKGEAAKPIASADKTVNEFFAHQILGVSALLEEPGGVSPNSKTRYITAAYRFRESTAELSKLCPVKVRNVVLVKDWLEFGIYMPRNEDYKPGETFEVYMELDYPTIRRTADGYNICVALSYELRDASANVVAKQDAAKPTLTTMSRKQDFCLTLAGVIPKTLQPGTYQLRISLTDLNDDTMQYTEEQIPLKVAPATETPE